MAGSLTHDIIKGAAASRSDRGWLAADGGGPDGRGVVPPGIVYRAVRSARRDHHVVRRIHQCVRGAARSRRRLGRRSQAPGILLVNTAVLLASSVALGSCPARAASMANAQRFNRWWTARDGCSASSFWSVRQWPGMQLKAAAGFFVATNPSSSFFYLLTASHAFHLFGGVLALLYVDVQALRLQLGPAKRTAIDVDRDFLAFSGWALVVPDGLILRSGGNAMSSLKSTPLHRRVVERWRFALRDRIPRSSGCGCSSSPTRSPFRRCCSRTPMRAWSRTRTGRRRSTSRRASSSPAS